MEAKKSNKLVALDADGNTFEFEIKNNFEFYHKKQKVNFELFEEVDGITLLCYNGLRYPVEVVSQKQNKYEILINGVSYFISVETSFSLKRAKILAQKLSAEKVILLNAPMPGKVLYILVSEGQKVQQGDTLLIYEAMKMQNTVTAPADAVVKKIHVSEKSAIIKDNLLIELERI